MAIVIPVNANLQPNDVNSLDDANTARRSVKYKGPYADLKTASGRFAQGDKFDTSWVLKNWTLERVAANLGVLTIGLVPEDPTVTEGEETRTEAFKTTWSVKSVRNDKSILAYCGAGASRENLELWMKETDKDALDQNGYLKTDGSVEPLNSVELAIAGKIKKGIESVIRFYPLVTRKKFYSANPADSMANLGYIDNLPSDAPGITGNYSWLKVQDDKDNDADGNFVRTESWMGALVSEGGWDANLYGENRWAMPYPGNQENQ